MLRVMLVFSSMLLLACGGRGGRGPSRHADGHYELACRGALRDCLAKAEHLCKEQGYIVTEARDIYERLGNMSGQSTIVLQKSDATIFCGNSARPTGLPAIRLQREPTPESGAAVPTSSATAAPGPTPPARACVPGATQSCIGPGGCSGGQACTADGSRFDTCDCGAASAPTPSP
jgi:hypothetical protein